VVPFAHAWIADADSGTDSESGCAVMLRLLFAHAFGTDGVAFPIDAPYDGPGYAVTPEGLQGCVTWATSNRSAVQVEAYTTARSSDADETVIFDPSSPRPGNSANEIALCVPESGEPTLSVSSSEWSPGTCDSA
jgi:hypothetical protein